MEFVNPGFLYGLFAVAIPILIHLFNFRRFKKVYFTNVKFIRELKKQTQKQSRLKHLLILLMRILAIVALVMAFSQPFIPQSGNIIKPDKQNALSIYIDNSFSMQAESEQSMLLENAKEKARDITSVFKTSDVFQLLTNDFKGKHQYFMSREEFLNMLDEVQVSPVVRSIPEIISHQSEFLKDQENATKSIFIISDFQKSILQLPINIVDSSLNIYFIPLKVINANNLSIDSCWFTSPVQQINQQVELIVRIRNYSDQNFEKIPLKLSINDQQKALASFDILAGSVMDIPLSYTNHYSGIQFGDLEISDYPISFDDHLYFSYNVSAVNRILSVNGKETNTYLKSLFQNDTAFVFENVMLGNIDYSLLSNFNLIILNDLDQIPSGLIQQIEMFVRNGGSLVVLPSDNIEINNYSDFLSSFGHTTYISKDTSDTDISYLNLQHPLYHDVFDEFPENIDLPHVFKSWIISRQTKIARETLLEMQNGNAFLSLLEYGKGQVFLFAVPLNAEFSNFPRHAIFVPTFYKIAATGILTDQLYYTIGDPEPVQVNNISLQGDAVFKINSNISDFEFIPGHRSINSHIDIYPHDQINLAANYSMYHNEEILKGLSFNYDRTESDMSFYTTEELEAYLSDTGNTSVMIIKGDETPFVQTLKALSQGVHLWRWFILLALMFLAIEVILLRFWK